MCRSAGAQNGDKMNQSESTRQAHLQTKADVQASPRWQGDEYLPNMQKTDRIWILWLPIRRIRMIITWIPMSSLTILQYNTRKSRRTLMIPLFELPAIN